MWNEVTRERLAGVSVHRAWEVMLFGLTVRSAGKLVRGVK